MNWSDSTHEEEASRAGCPGWRPGNNSYSDPARCKGKGRSTGRYRQVGHLVLTARSNGIAAAKPRQHRQDAEGVALRTFRPLQAHAHVPHLTAPTVPDERYSAAVRLSNRAFPVAGLAAAGTELVQSERRSGQRVSRQGRRDDRAHRWRSSNRHPPEGAADQPGSALVRDDRGDRSRPGGGPLVLPGRRRRGNRREVHLRLRHGGQRRRLRQGGPVRLDGAPAGHARQGIPAER